MAFVLDKIFILIDFSLFTTTSIMKKAAHKNVHANQTIACVKYLNEMPCLEHAGPQIAAHALKHYW